MIENEEANRFDTFRMIIFVMMITMLLSPGNNQNASSNLRSSEQEKKIRLIRTSLEKKMEIDLSAMIKNNLRYSYNISGLYYGKWKLSNTTVIQRSSDIVFDMENEVKRKNRNSTLKGKGGDLSIQLYDRGMFKKNINYITGVLTLIEGEQDSKEDAFSLSLTGVYIIPTGHLTLFANTYGSRYLMRWNSSYRSENVTVNNDMPTIVGYSHNKSNLLYLSEPQRYTEDSLYRCLYRFDADFITLGKDVHQEISLNNMSRILLNATGGMTGRNCGVNTEFHFDGFNMDTNHLILKSRIYTVIALAISSYESVLYIKLMQQLIVSSAVSSSLILFLFLSSIDLILAMLHSLSALLLLGMFSNLFLVSFHKLFMFSVVEMRLIFIVWKSKYPEMDNTNYSQYQRKLSLVFVSLYILIISALISIYSGNIFRYFFIFVLYSFWLPQIIRSLQLGQRSPFTGAQIISTSLCKLFYPAYLLLCPKNLMAEYSGIALPKSVGLILVGWVSIQTILVLVQQRYNPYLILPSFLRPKKYNYHSLPTTDVEIDDDCAICMNSIDFDEKQSYMVTPCNHAFHTECLYKWMDVKLECPTCRSSLPDVRYL